MSTSFFTNQKLPISKNTMTHLEYLLGNIAFIRPADIDDRSQRSKQVSGCSGWTDQSTTYLWQFPKAIAGCLRIAGTAFPSMLKRSALTSGKISLGWTLWCTHGTTLPLPSQATASTMLSPCVPEILFYSQHRDPISELRNALQQKIEKNWPRKPYTLLYTV